MKPGLKSKAYGVHKGHSKLLALSSKPVHSSTVVMASALFFFAGWLRSSLSPTHHPLTSAQRELLSTASLDEPAGGVSSEGEPQRPPEFKQTVPVYDPFPRGATGEEKVHNIPFQLLSWKPRAFIFPSFAPPDICDKIVQVANKTMSPSGLALKAGEREEDQKDVRTSTGAYLSGAEDPALAWVEKKMAMVTALPVEHGEPFNILRYVKGQKYQAHMDTFDPKDFGPQRSNRVASFLLYLTDVEEGGETSFPQEGGIRRTGRFDVCEGLKVKPRKGDALLFWSMTPERTIDPDALHAGCPVIKGEKWVATKWIRDGAD